MPYGEIKIFSGNSNRPLAEKICERLGVPLGKASAEKFKNGEIKVQILENTRGKDVFVVQSGAQPINDNLVELLLMIDALRRASAGRITVVMPLFFYSRQDRKDRPRVPISSKLIANLLVAAGAKRILTMDLHADQIEGFFDIPFDKLFASYFMLPYLRDNFDDNLVIVSPDAGGVLRAEAYAKRLGVPIAVIIKRRGKSGEVEKMTFVGDVKGKDAIIVDDMIDSGGTLIKATETALEHGAKSVWVCAPHAIFSGNAEKNLASSPLSQIIVSDTLPVSHFDKLKVLSSSETFAEAIKRIHEEKSLSDLCEIPS
jgi:ribose-phosphate pyrophosphokinase